MCRREPREGLQVALVRGGFEVAEGDARGPRQREGVGPLAERLGGEAGSGGVARGEPEAESVSKEQQITGIRWRPDQLREESEELPRGGVEESITSGM